MIGQTEIMIVFPVVVIAKAQSIGFGQAIDFSAEPLNRTFDMQSTGARSGVPPVARRVSQQADDLEYVVDRRFSSTGRQIGCVFFVIGKPSKLINDLVAAGVLEIGEFIRRKCQTRSSRQACINERPRPLPCLFPGVQRG